jgi:hypothetical protein
MLAVKAKEERRGGGSVEVPAEASLAAKREPRAPSPTTPTRSFCAAAPPPFARPWCRALPTAPRLIMKIKEIVFLFVFSGSTGKRTL